MHHQINDKPVNSTMDEFHHDLIDQRESDRQSLFYKIEIVNVHIFRSKFFHKESVLTVGLALVAA